MIFEIVFAVGAVVCVLVAIVVLYALALMLEHSVYTLIHCVAVARACGRVRGAWWWYPVAFARLYLSNFVSPPDATIVNGRRIEWPI